MVRKDVDINITVKKKDNELKQLNAEVRKTTDEYIRAVREFGKGSKEVEQAGQRYAKAKNDVKQVRDELKQLEGATRSSGHQTLNTAKNYAILAMGILEVGRAVKQTFAQLKEMTMQGTEFGVLKENFVELEGSIEGAEKKLNLLYKASSGNLNDQELMQYANMMKLIGINSDDTVRLLDFVERQSDKVNITFAQGESALQSYILTGAGKGLKTIGVNIADVEKEIEKMTGATIEQVKQLSLEDQQLVRTQALLRLYGGALDQVEQKTKDNADRLVSFQKEIETSRLKVGLFIGNGLLKMVDALGMTDEKATGLIGTVTELGSGLGALLPVAASVKLAFGGMFVGVGGLIAGATAGFAALTVQIVAMIDQIRRVPDTISAVDRIMSGENIFGVWADETKKRTYGLLDFTSGKTPITLPPNSDMRVKDALVKNQEKLNRAVEEGVEKRKEEKRLQDEIGKIKGNTGKSGTSSAKEEKDLIGELIKGIQDEIQNLEYKHDLTSAILQSKVDELNAGFALSKGIEDENKLYAARLEIFKKMGEYGPLGKKVELGTDPYDINNTETSRQPLEEIVKKQDFGEFMRGMLQGAVDMLLDAVGSGLGNIKNILSEFGVQEYSTASKILGLFQSMVNVVQNILSLFQAIKTTIDAVNLITSIIPFLNEGTDNFPGGMAIVGDGPGGRITPYTELVNMPRGSSITPMKNIMEYIDRVSRVRNQPSVTNVYLTGKFDGTTWYEEKRVQNQIRRESRKLK